MRGLTSANDPVKGILIPPIGYLMVNTNENRSRLCNSLNALSASSFSFEDFEQSSEEMSEIAINDKMV